MIESDVIADARRTAEMIEAGQAGEKELREATALLRSLIDRIAQDRLRMMRMSLTYWKAGRNASAAAMMDEDPDEGGMLFAEAHEARDHIMSLDPLQVPDPVTVDGDLAAMRELVCEMFTFARTADGRELIDRDDVVQMLDMAIYTAPASGPGL